MADRAMTAEEQEDERPWSPAEVERDIRRLKREVRDTVQELKRLGREASKMKWRYERELAKAILKAEGTNDTKRKAAAVLAEAEVPSESGGVVSKKLWELGFEMDVAERSYKDQDKILRALDTDLRVCQSLLASHRKVD